MHGSISCPSNRKAIYVRTAFRSLRLKCHSFSNLCMVGICADAHQRRHGSLYSVKNAEMSFSSQTGGFKLAPIQNGLEKPDCCPDCSSKLQHECSILMNEGQTLCGGSGPPPAGPAGYYKLPWMQNPNDKGRATLPVSYEVVILFEPSLANLQDNCVCFHA